MLDPEEMLAALRRTADQLAELVEWQRLATQERQFPEDWARDCPLRIDHHFTEDARDLYGRFLLLAHTLRVAMQSSADLAARNCAEGWTRQLSDLENRVRGLHITARFIKP